MERKRKKANDDSAFSAIVSTRQCTRMNLIKDSSRTILQKKTLFTVINFCPKEQELERNFRVENKSRRLVLSETWQHVAVFTTHKSQKSIRIFCLGKLALAFGSFYLWNLLTYLSLRYEYDVLMSF